ncbi:hypothetical protein [Methanonatronarchaeum sp. AMET-Sl]|uniref:hypothetical protein n=1 Tax=Methanonatronarchaeum sp. AMET-Sl TaxID=3037654 RepID=UPI00244E4F97|nr:hypothetical protein [Methanonatronarchaeum sp. AMET-Sl]WGI17665.1 hypothetical protein QEN48_01255 [Methanonatronarchaeum sp. AMET-Sl]
MTTDKSRIIGEKIQNSPTPITQGLNRNSQSKGEPSTISNVEALPTFPSVTALICGTGL